MKRDNADLIFPRKSLRRLAQSRQTVQEQPPEKQSSKSTLLASMSQRVCEVLDGLSRTLNDIDFKSLDEDKIIQMRQLFAGATEGLTLQEMHNLEYSNRLCYIRKAMERRNFKTKNWLTLANLVQNEIKRVKNVYFKHLENIDHLIVRYQDPDWFRHT